MSLHCWENVISTAEVSVIGLKPENKCIELMSIVPY